MTDRSTYPSTTTATLEDWRAFLNDNSDIEYVDAVFTDQIGTVRGKRVPVGEAEKIFTAGLQLPLSIYFFDVTGVNEDVCGRGYSDGDPDGTAWPIAGSIARVPWSEVPLAQVMMTMNEPDGSPCVFEPRKVLSATADRLSALGLTPVTAVELEFYLIDPERTPAGFPQPPLNPETGKRESANEVYGLTELETFSALLSDIDVYSEALNVPASAAVAEFSPGQYEINLHHTADPVRGADQGILLRYLIGAAARKHDMQATFMAKPYLDQTGNGCHVHASLLNDAGENVFADESQLGSDMLRHAIGGLQATLPDAMAIFAPNFNSYRRFVPDNYVAVNGSWGANNRSVAFRIPTGDVSARRVEHRVSGADANPYLVMAALLAGMHYGIERKLDPGVPATGNVSADVDPDLPLTLTDALERFRQSAVLRDYLGNDFVDIYAETKRLELEKFQSEITSREISWYL